MKKKLFVITMISLLFISCPDKKSASKEKLLIYTSILPQTSFVSRIAGKHAKVKTLVGPGKSPATYEPTPQQMMDLSKADLFFTIAVPFEKAFLPRITKSLPELKIMDTSQNIKKRRFTSFEEHHHEAEEHHHEAEEHHHEAEEHHHEAEEHHHEAEEHHHEAEDHRGDFDPHSWLAPLLVKKQAELIKEELIKIDSKNKADYQKNYQDLAKELEELDQKLRQTLAPLKGKPFFVFHPAFGYLADAYGLKQIAIESGGKSPSPADLEKIIKLAKSKGVNIIFVQPEFSQKSAEAIAKAIDGAVVSLNPLHPDYLKNMQEMAEKIREGLE